MMRQPSCEVLQGNDWKSYDLMTLAVRIPRRKMYLVASTHPRLQRLDLIANLDNYTRTFVARADCPED
jgi:hypothetical protein